MNKVREKNRGTVQWELNLKTVNISVVYLAFPARKTFYEWWKEKETYTKSIRKDR